MVSFRFVSLNVISRPRQMASEDDSLRGAFHSFEKAYEIFFRTKGFLRIFDGFFLQTKGFLPKAYEIFWSEMPLDSLLLNSYEFSDLFACSSQLW